MADTQPPSVREGAAAADLDDEVPAAAKSAEDRKAASALASLDATNDDSAAHEVDHEAVSKAMKALGGPSSASAAASSASASSRKNVKVDAADVALLVDELELPKPKATELLKSHDGDAVKALRAYVKA